METLQQKIERAAKYLNDCSEFLKTPTPANLLRARSAFNESQLLLRTTAFDLDGLIQQTNQRDLNLLFGVREDGS